jgi:hypothetical protein
MAYTKTDIQEMVATPPMLYQLECINYKDKTAAGDWYTEIMAEYILDEIVKHGDKVFRLPTVGGERKNFVFSKHFGTKGSSTKGLSSGRGEEQLCLEEFDGGSAHGATTITSAPSWGSVINYQVNLLLKTKVNIDLVSYDRATDTAYIIEVKGSNLSKSGKTGADYNETLLRSMLEIYTYEQLLLRVKADFLATFRSGRSSGVSDLLPTTKIAKGIYVPSKSRVATEYEEMTRRGKRPHLAKLFANLEFNDDSVKMY